jgi:hypothetical protein
LSSVDLATTDDAQIERSIAELDRRDPLGAVRDDLASIKQQSGVPEALEGCHSTLVGGYVVEGHVPVDVVKRLLKDRPPIRGISLPGMPEGSPGMSGEKSAPFVIHEISDGAAKVYATE